MALSEKKKIAIATAVACMIQKEDAEAQQSPIARNMWVSMGKASIMQGRERVQRRGRSLAMH